MPGIPMPAVALYAGATDLLGFLVLNGLPLDGGHDRRGCFFSGIGSATGAGLALGDFVRSLHRTDLACAVEPEGDGLHLVVEGPGFRAVFELDRQRKGHWRVERAGTPMLAGRCALGAA